MKRFKVGLVAVALLSALAFASIALAAGSTPQGGALQIFGTETSPLDTKLLFTGAVGDHGSAVTLNTAGKPDPHGTIEKVTLQKGSFVIDTTPLGTKLGKMKPTVNSETCTISLAATGPTKVEEGTGLYAGISGHLNIRFTVATLQPRNKNGKCALTAKPVSEYTAIIGSGSVSFSG
jgi:hypothetical protein